MELTASKTAVLVIAIARDGSISTTAGLKGQLLLVDFENKGQLQRIGGSLFAMTDPFWMIVVMEPLGRGYTVWDKAADIEFIKAVREPVYAQIRVDPVAIAELRSATASGEKVLRWFETEIRTAAGELVARSRKQLHVRLKRGH